MRTIIVLTLFNKCFRKMGSPNLHKICRLCMSQTGVMVHIFEAPETKEHSVPLPVRIMMCVSIKVSFLVDEYVCCHNMFR
jgi:hypothetical protein